MQKLDKEFDRFESKQKGGDIESGEHGRSQIQRNLVGVGWGFMHIGFNDMDLIPTNITQYKRKSKKEVRHVTRKFGTTQERNSLT